MKVAVIGGGISGLTVAWLLRNQCEVTLFEKGQRVGGHSNTAFIEKDGLHYAIDTGFIVYNDRTYPNFIRLLKHLGVEGVPTGMSFAVRCDRSQMEYCGSSLAGLFAQPSNLASPRFLRMVADILRFNRLGSTDLEQVDSTMTVREYLQRHRFGNGFANHYLLPMGAAIWSCPTGTFADFPIRFILDFYRNHGLLSIRNRPQWYTIRGGSWSYVSRLAAVLGHRIQSGAQVTTVRRQQDAVEVEVNGSTQTFDEVIFACHSDQTLRTLADATSLEQQVLSAFPYEENEAVLHTDESVLPLRRTAWAAWNYRIRNPENPRPSVTYNMNMLQHVSSKHTFCVTLNDTANICPESIIGRYTYAHPVFTAERAAMQSRHCDLIRSHRTSFCGAYWGNGFHEDGVVSALKVAQRFGVESIDASARGEVAFV